MVAKLDPQTTAEASNIVATSVDSSITSHRGGSTGTLKRRNLEGFLRHNGFSLRKKSRGEVVYCHPSGGKISIPPKHSKMSDVAPKTAGKILKRLEVILGTKLIVARGCVEMSAV